MKYITKNKHFTIAVIVAFLALNAPFNVFAQDWKTLMVNASNAHKAKNYEETFNLATQAWKLATQPNQKYLTATFRSFAVKDGYLRKGWTLSGNEYTHKYDAETVEKIRIGIADLLFVLDYLDKDSSATADAKNSKGDLSFSLGLFYVSLANQTTGNLADYANAEKYLRLGANLGVSSGDPQYHLVRSIVGQGKFDAARAEAVRQLTSGKDYAVYASKTIDDFDFVGELYLSSAFLLAEASRLKAAGKPLTELQKAVASHEINLRNIRTVTNPVTAFELNRLGALLFGANQSDKAAETLERAAQIGSYNPTALRWLAMVRLQQKNYPAAETLAAKILSANPTDVVGLTTRGLIAATKNNLPQAEKDLTQAISTYPEAALFANTYKILALVYQKQNKTAQMNETLAKQKALSDLYLEVSKLKPKSYADESLDKSNE